MNLQITIFISKYCNTARKKWNERNGESILRDEHDVFERSSSLKEVNVRAEIFVFEHGVSFIAVKLITQQQINWEGTRTKEEWLIINFPRFAGNRREQKKIWNAKHCCRHNHSINKNQKRVSVVFLLQLNCRSRWDASNHFCNASSSFAIHLGTPTHPQRWPAEQV